MFEGLMVDLKTNIQGTLVYAVYDDDGRILNTGRCPPQALELTAALWPKAHKRLYDTNTVVPDVLHDRIDVKTGRILRNVAKHGDVKLFKWYNKSPPTYTREGITMNDPINFQQQQLYIQSQMIELYEKLEQVRQS